MEKTKKYEMDMCTGSVFKKMLLFSVPLIFSGILQLLFNAADVIVVGRFAGEESLAAVGSTGSLINLLTNLFMGLSIGANVLVARYYGAKQKEDLSNTIHTAMALSIVSGILLTMIGVIGAPVILGWMNTPKEVLSLAVVYLRVYFLGMTAMMVYNFGSAILRAIGDTRRPLYYLTAAGVVNVVLNLIFVIGFKAGVFGVALATAISQCVSAVLILRCLVQEKEEIRLYPKQLHINKKVMFRIMQIGLPAGFQGILFSLSNVCIQSSINSFGKIVVAGNSAASNVEGFVYVAMNAFHQSTISFVSQNVGAGAYNRINKIVYTAMGCVFIVGAVLGNAVMFLGKPLLSLYSDNHAVLEAGMDRLQVIATTYALCGVMDVMVGALRGLGYSIVPMIISLIGVCALRLIWLATVFQMEQFHNIQMVYITYPISWTLTILAQVTCFLVIRRKLKKAWGV